MLGEGYAGARFREVLYLINVDKVTREFSALALQGRAFVLHPVHTSPTAADKRVFDRARYDRATGTFSVPARTAVVFVVK